MGVYVKIYCQSSRTISFGEIKTFIREGVYFEDELIYSSLLSENDPWEGTFAVCYDGNRGDRTFQFDRSTDQNFIQSTLDDLSILSVPLQDAANTWDIVRQELRVCQQYLSIKLPQDLLLHPDEEINSSADEMLYNLEVHLATELSGVIAQTEDRGEAFYDQNFNLIALLTKVH